MKKFLIAMMVVASTMTTPAFDAEAKRLGSGSSIGKQSNNVSRQAAPAAAPAHNAATPAAAPAATPAVAPPKPGIPWKGIAGGLIGGALLAAALSHLGLGGALASMLGSLLTFALIGLVIFFVVRFFRNRNRQGTGNGFNQPAFAGAPAMPSAVQPMAFQNNAPGSSGGTASNNANWTIPADFDVPGFLRNAKTYFIRLQAAWDKADINDLREFTTAEMYAELKLQIQDRGASSNVTDVVTLNADMLGVETTATEYLASVKFSGMIKESANAPAEAFTEVWNLSKSVNGQGGWVLAGIQQM